MPNISNGYPKFFGSFSPNGIFCRIIMEQPGGGFDQHPIGVTVHVRGETKLTSEQHRLGAGVVEEQGCPIATIVRLSLLALHGAVVTSVVEGCPPKNVPPIGNHLDVNNGDVGVTVQPQPNVMEPGASPTVGHVAPAHTARSRTHAAGSGRA